MNKSLILKQHMPYAQIISKALAFSQSMLTYSCTLYPYAVLSIDNDINCVFVPSDGQEASSGMIEDLQQQINERKLFAENAVSLLVYSATVTHPDRSSSDALVFTITDSQGQNTVTIYPYNRNKTGIKFYRPYTCDFSD